ncbi:MAG: hypothetical protein JO163_13905 [Methylobacteriaceae bacterium]|nr:hypothetical protein [Methylobacteriaceae bacterium]
MNLDGAMNAKAEAFEEAFGYREIVRSAVLNDSGPLFAPPEGSSTLKEIARHRKERKPDPRDLIALGVLRPSGHNRDPAKLRIGIFLQQKRLSDHPIVEKVQGIAKGESKTIVTGPAERRGATNGGRCRPLRIGASIGHHRITAGTLACFASNRNGGGIGLLSNNHVLADINSGRSGDPILQPARSDGGDRKNPDYHVANLQRFVPINFNLGSINLVDCAFAYLVDGVERDTGTVYDPQNDAPLWRVGEMEDLLYGGLPVKKVGRTTGYTDGIVEAVAIDNLNVNMTLGASPKMARFDRQIAISGNGKSFSKKGDSGSLIFAEGGRPAALLFAGTERGGAGNHGITYANPIATVLQELEVDIYIGA